MYVNIIGTDGDVVDITEFGNSSLCEITTALSTQTSTISTITSSTTIASTTSTTSTTATLLPHTSTVSAMTATNPATITTTTATTPTPSTTTTKTTTTSTDVDNIDNHIVSAMSPTVSRVPQICRCPCNKVGDPAVKNMTVAETLEAVKQLKQELAVDISELSSTIRKKISAPDERPSSKGIGALGIVMLTGILCMLVAADASVLVRDFKNGFRNLGILKEI